MLNIKAGVLCRIKLIRSGMQEKNCITSFTDINNLIFLTLCVKEFEIQLKFICAELLNHIH